MLLSMTGYGESRGETPTAAVSLEIRSVNNRHLKVSVRGSEPYPILDAEFEKVVRRSIKRGTLHVNIRVDRPRGAGDAQINGGLLAAYLDQVRAACPEASQAAALGPLLAGLLALPGVAPEPGGRGAAPEDEWPLVERLLGEALDKLNAVRQAEGRAMADELLALRRRFADELEAVKAHAPRVVEDYRQRLLERIRQALAGTGATIEPEQLIRDVAIYADRTDVAEEIVRLDAHLVQLADVVAKAIDAPGRRLEFVIQEMGRETNTLGSKAGDVAISRHVIEMKATLEKMKELVANVE
ncbi:MAG: YicC family protein [Gemmataceae bacterium]|nr:YicC family protein [Gemmataceae bacterium]